MIAAIMVTEISMIMIKTMINNNGDYGDNGDKSFNINNYKTIIIITIIPMIKW